ncbi:MAG: acetate--CoA ligase family protein, partial [Deltaproteobacteria bacterium]|nr:acetate--CoA ligase family protein [Deltaproteobacteria bacterium]
MKIHEYQAKELLKKAGVAVPAGKVAATPEETLAIAKEIGLPVVIKAQIHAGGRGKGGGIKVAKTITEAQAAAKKIIGMNLVTHQTGPAGKKVKKVLVEEASDIAKEFYLGMVLDRARSRIVMMASPEGGVEIETVAAKSPEKIFKIWIDPEKGLQNSQTEALASQLKLDSKKFGEFASALYHFYFKNDASLAEINPLV